MSVPRRGHAAILLPDNASVLVGGGTSNGVAQSAVDLFLPAEFPDPFSYGVGQFAPTGAMSAARTAGVTTPTGIEGYAIADGGGASNAEVYRFATIRTDKDDYAPGELALITGTGWQPNETVRLTFQEDPAVHDDYVIDVVADPQGNLRWDQWAPEYHDLGVRFYLMASGGVSKAQTTFTDALKVTVKRRNPNAATFRVASGSTTPVTFELINANTGGDKNSSINISYSLTVTGATATGIPLTASGITIPSNSSIFRTWSIVVPTGPASATVTLSATVNLCPACDVGTDSYTINVAAPPPSDSTPPVITPNITGTLGNNGWYTSNVDLTWTVTDPQSSISSSTGCSPSSVTTDTAGTTFTCSATSAGGTSNSSVTIKRDASKPNAPTASATPPPNGSGWNNTDVTVAFASAGDNGPSGVLSCTPSSTLTAETAGTAVTGTCTDNAGNVSDASSLTVKIDKSAPNAPIASATPAPNASGWNNTDVTVAFASAGDNGPSGVLSCTASSTLTAETAGTAVSGTCTDTAGNVSGTSSVTVKIDKTAPNAPTSSATPAPNASGWNTTDVTVAFASAGDNGPSGVASCTASQSFTTETSGTLVSGTCIDNAGNTSAATDVTVKIDKTAPNPPTATRTPPANAAGWNNSDVTVSFVSAGDVGPSGVASCTTPTTLTAETAGTNGLGHLHRHRRQRQRDHRRDSEDRQDGAGRAGGVALTGPERGGLEQRRRHGLVHAVDRRAERHRLVHGADDVDDRHRVDGRLRHLH